MYRIALRRGLADNCYPGTLALGETAYLTNSKKLIVGNPASEKGYDIIAEVVLGPHDNNLYAKLTGHEQLQPIGLVKY